MMNAPRHFLSARSSARGGFSLIEVITTIGIIAIALIPLIGLLPIGLNALKSSREQAAAAVCATQIAESLRTAISPSSNNYQASGIWGAYLPTWTSGGGAVVATPDPDISLGGNPVPTSTASNLDKRLKAHVEITPANNTALTCGSALISVAWPNAPTTTWDAGNKKWIKAEGSVSAWVILLPQP